LGLKAPLKTPQSEKVEDSDANKVIISLLEETLNRATKSQGVSRDYLAHMAPGKMKRRIVDDISIMVVNLHQ
jgi:hypothetical protein